MTQRNHSRRQITIHTAKPRNIQEFGILLRRLLNYANLGVTRTEFLYEASKVFLDFSGCEAIELRLKERGKIFICETIKETEYSNRIEIIPDSEDSEITLLSELNQDLDTEWLLKIITAKLFNPSSPYFTKTGSFWTGDTRKHLKINLMHNGESKKITVRVGDDYQSLAVIPIMEDSENAGFLQLKSKHNDYFTLEDIEFYECVAQSLGHGAVVRRMQVSLRERVKELTCLYRISQLAEQPDISIEEIIQGIAELLPPSWLYPDIAYARINLDGYSFSTSSSQEKVHKQASDITVNGERRGFVEVAYTEKMHDLDEGPFLKEERELIDRIASKISYIIARKEVEDDKFKLQEQLRHADRLATIGQLAAGVAHELNEPLGSILGFAQLIDKTSEFSKQTQQDIKTIISASLYSREIIKKLLLFARQKIPEKTRVDMNQIVEEATYFLKSQCVKTDVELICKLSPSLPEITVDHAQMHQVLVNLMVNAFQAMSDGGRLTIETKYSKNQVFLIVEDTGEGMSKEVQKQIFLPFFTTKDIGEGTGLGLPVVHGIITSHGGLIEVESAVGHGSRFEIRLPVEELPEGEHRG
jgi:signal transduction histidine kinase